MIWQTLRGYATHEEAVADLPYALPRRAGEYRLVEVDGRWLIEWRDQPGQQPARPEPPNARGT